MALEQEIQKLTAAVETLTKTIQGASAPIAAPVTTAATPAKGKNKGAAAAEQPAPAADVDPFAPAEEAVTLESLSDLLKKHAKVLGTKVTIALILKHGADKTTPKIATIPAANFKACSDEAAADLAKVEGKTK